MSVLVFAGVDPSGSAGLTRDLWTLERAAVPALAVPSCVTVQTEDTQSARALDPAWIEAALGALRGAHEIRVVKTGLVLDAASWDAATPTLRALASEGRAIVVDPCRGPSSGGFRVEESVRDVLLGPIAQLGCILTPNLPELAWLCGVEAAELDDEALCGAATRLLELGYAAVVVKGGHANASGALVDRFFAAGEAVSFERLRLAGSRRGTGCVFASYLAAALWKELDLRTAVRLAGHQLGQSWRALAR